jgi:Flp pilus assembly protein TadD
MTLEAAGDRGRALEAYEQLLAASPTNVVALNNLAYALTSEPADLERAQVLARQAYELSRGEPTVADTYGWVLHLRGEHGQAVRVLREVVSRQPDLAEGHVHLALALLAQGVEGEARQHWEKALSLDAALAARDEAEPLARAFGSGGEPNP